MTGGASGQPRLGPGATIAGYVLESRIGRGGMAAVFRAMDERLSRPVALKVLAPGLTSDDEFRKRFLRESRAAAAVDHPNIVPIYEAGEFAGYLYIAMRYVRGGDVKSVLRQDGPLTAARTWSIISQAAAALDAAHGRGLVHRDVKPANILLHVARAARGDRAEHVYLTDFGVSKQVAPRQLSVGGQVNQASQLTTVGQIVGTLEYTAPEQIEGSQLDGRTDVYSLACTAFEMLAGTPPFHRGLGPALIYAHLSEHPPSLAARRPELSVAVDQVLARALAKAPPARYPSCGRFAEDLGRALRLVPGRIEALRQPMTPPVRARRPRGSLADEVAKPVRHPTPPASPVAPAGSEPPTRKRQT